MKINKQQLRKMINEAFRGYQYASRDGSRYQGAGPSQTFKLKEADVIRLEQVILESLQASLKSGHQLATAVHSAAFNVQQSGAIPVLNMEVSEFDDEYIKDYLKQGDENHADHKKAMRINAERALEAACDNVYRHALDVENVSHELINYVLEFIRMLKEDIMESVKNI